MFYYYGTKWGSARRYPPPRFGTIVEPFAGAAGYSMKYLTSVDRVILVEKDPVTVELWRRVLAMTPDDLRALPRLVTGDYTADPLAMMTETSASTSGKSRVKITDRMVKNYEAQRRRMAALLGPASRKVEVIGPADYTAAPDTEATWYVDPPYANPEGGIVRGDGYRRDCRARDLDFDAPRPVVPGPARASHRVRER